MRYKRNITDKPRSHFMNSKGAKSLVKDRRIRLRNSAGKYIDTDEDICEDWNAKFQCVFTLEASKVPSLSYRKEGDTSGNSEVKHLGLRRLMKQLDSQKIYGLDGILLFIFAGSAKNPQ